LGASGRLRGRTGLSVPIFFACPQAKKDFHFYPLRVPRRAVFPRYDTGTPSGFLVVIQGLFTFEIKYLKKSLFDIKFV
jgi:hypothetical protein